MAAQWTYLGCPVTSDPMPSEVFGFIYLITFTDGRKYIGKKQVFLQRKLKPRKGDRKNAKRIKWYESKWFEYEGSSKHRGDRIIATKEILRFCYSKKELTYFEEKEQWLQDVLYHPQYINANIRGVYFRGEFE